MTKRRLYGSYSEIPLGAPFDRRLTNRPFGDRFWSRVDQSRGADACWWWVGRVNLDGYGIYRHDGKMRTAHRIAWILTNGAIESTLHVDHLCRNRSCVNPKHLEPVTGRENTLRGEGPFAIRARQTHCHRGHEFTPENTYLGKQRGGRECRACGRDRAALRRNRAA